MALPRGTTGSLRPTFVSARLVSLAVKRAYAFALVERFPTALSPPSRASVLFGRRPPQSNCPPCAVPDPDDGSRLDIHIDKGGISRVAPRELAPALQSLPPILHMPTRMPVQSYSQGARGLSV